MMSSFFPFSRTVLGVLFMALGVFIFATVNALVKDVVASYPLMQVVFFRFFLALFPCIYLVYKSGGWSTLKTPNLKFHLFSGVLCVINLGLLFSAFKLLPLADANALSFSSIIFVTLMSYPLLKEPVGRQRWIAILLGFVGVTIMARPTGDFMNPGIIMCLLFALGDALIMVFARLLSRTDKSSTIVFYCSFFAAVVAGFFLPHVWVVPTPLDGIKFLVLGVGAGTAQIFLTYAYRYAQAALVAPVLYTSLLWSSFYGYTFWGECPGHNALLGASVLILSGLYLVYSEQKMPLKSCRETAL